MKHEALNDELAWSQIEAMADGSLQGASRARMQEAMRRDPSLDAAVRRAAVLHRELRRSLRPVVPSGLLGRLLDIPGGATTGSRWFTAPTRTLLGAAAAAAVVAVVAVLTMQPPDAPEELDQRIVALQEFELAMKYLQQSAAITGVEVRDAVGDGVREALIVSRDSIREARQESGG